jgi:hypothetical protein
LLSTEEVPMSDSERPLKRPSASAEAAALRWQEQHDEEAVERLPAPQLPEDENVVPNRHSASAEAAALRWHEQHDEDDS